MGALGAENTRRGEFVSKRAVFEGIAADPALDGGLVACTVSSGSGSGHGGGAACGHGSGKSNSSADPVDGDGGGNKGGSSRALADSDHARSKLRHRSGLGQQAPMAGGQVDAMATDSSVDGRKDKRVAALDATGNKNSRRGGGKSDKAAAGKNNNDDRRRKQQKLLASTSTCATAGGTTAPASLLLPRGGSLAAAAAHLRGDGAANTNDRSLGPSSDGDRRTSSILVWPGKLEAAAGAPGLEVRVPHRLTCVRATAFEARFKGAHNALLAGTKGGLALAFDWGCLLRESGGRGGGTTGGDSDGAGKKERGINNGVLAPSAQVMSQA